MQQFWRILKFVSHEFILLPQKLEWFALKFSKLKDLRTVVLKVVDIDPRGQLDHPRGR